MPHAAHAQSAHPNIPIPTIISRHRSYDIESIKNQHRISHPNGREPGAGRASPCGAAAGQAFPVATVLDHGRTSARARAMPAGKQITHCPDLCADAVHGTELINEAAAISRR